VLESESAAAAPRALRSLAAALLSDHTEA
jgi:hypothetical protein